MVCDSDSKGWPDETLTHQPALTWLVAIISSSTPEHRLWPIRWACLGRCQLVVNAGFHFVDFFLLQWAPGWLSLQHPWIISLCIKWAAVPLIANQGRTGKPSLVPWLMIYTPLISSWADFHQGRGNSLLSISQAWFPSSTMVVRGAGGHHGQCSGGPWWQWGSHWWTAGQVESASTDSAVGKGDNLQKGFDLNCPVQSCGCAGSAWSSEHSSPGVAAFGDRPRSLPTMVGQADLCATALWLLTALICTLSSIHSYSWVRKIPECKDYMERISWKKKKKKNYLSSPFAEAKLFSASRRCFLFVFGQFCRFISLPLLGWRLQGFPQNTFGGAKPSTPAVFSQSAGMINKSAPTDLRVWGCLWGTSSSFK